MKDIFCGTPPLGFTFGLGGMLLFPFRYGASCVLFRKPTPEVVIEAIKKFDVSILFATPTGYRMMLRSEFLSPQSSLRCCIAAGEHLPSVVQSEWQKKMGINLINAIGSTELLHVFISGKNDDLKLGATGRPINGYQAKIIDKNNKELGANKVGYLAVQGPTGCVYNDNEVAQSKYVINGWNVTGDLFWRDEEGYYYFHSRADDMIITSGYNVSCVEVENILLSHPKVLEACIIGVPDELRGQVINAYVVPTDLTHPPTTETLLNFMLEHLAKYKCPRKIHFIDKLPRTTTGKLQRSYFKQHIH